jgi:hypothetical protein
VRSLHEVVLDAEHRRRGNVSSEALVENGVLGAVGLQVAEHVERSASAQ